MTRLVVNHFLEPVLEALSFGYLGDDCHFVRFKDEAACDERGRTSGQPIGVIIAVSIHFETVDMDVYLLDVFPADPKNDLSFWCFLNKPMYIRDDSHSLSLCGSKVFGGCRGSPDTPHGLLGRAAERLPLLADDLDAM